MTEIPDNSDPRDYVLDLSTTRAESASEPTPHPTPAKNKVAYISIHFKCCRIYAPIYKNAANTAYSGHCPRCHRPAQIQISPTGSPSRIFEAG